jgi:hypothetical protein
MPVLHQLQLVFGNTVFPKLSPHCMMTDGNYFKKGNYLRWGVIISTICPLTICSFNNY